MILYKVKGRTILNDTKIDKDFTNEKDAIAYIKKMGARQGVNAQIVKIDNSHEYRYSYNSNREKVIKLLDTYGISYELDDGLNIKIIF